MLESDLLEVIRAPKTENDVDGPAPTVTLRRNDFRSSTKLEALLQNLRTYSYKPTSPHTRLTMFALGTIRATDPSFRAVVFSQFTTFLDLIQLVLERERLRWYRFDGTMDIKKRSEAVSGFKEASEDPKVLIVSLKAGGVGLNVSAYPVASRDRQLTETHS